MRGDDGGVAGGALKVMERLDSVCLIVGRLVLIVAAAAAFYSGLFWLYWGRWPQVVP